MKRIGVVFGGKSAEHEVSIRSACTIIRALDLNLYKVVLIGVDLEGGWHSKLYTADQSDHLELVISDVLLGESEVPSYFFNKEHPHSIDLAFPIIHGPFGEDGALQGLLKMANIPYVGADILGSAIGMDKDVMKRLLKEADFKVANFRVLRVEDMVSTTFEDLKRELGLPFFIKPCNMGSSVGIFKIINEQEFDKNIQEVFLFDSKMIAEQAIVGREIECSVMGVSTIHSSIPAEVLMSGGFYDYEAKYDSLSTASLAIPAEISPIITERIQTLAIRVFKVLCCKGLARVDFFLTKSGDIFVNEINTLPGFTSKSAYPKMWEASGLPLTKLLNELIEMSM